MKVTATTKIEQKPDKHNGTRAEYKMLINGEDTGVMRQVDGGAESYWVGRDMYGTLPDALVAAGHEVIL